MPPPSPLPPIPHKNKKKEEEKKSKVKHRRAFSGSLTIQNSVALIHLTMEENKAAGWFVWLFCRELLKSRHICGLLSTGERVLCVCTWTSVERLIYTLWHWQRDTRQSWVSRSLHHKLAIWNHQSLNYWPTVTYQQKYCGLHPSVTLLQVHTETTAQASHSSILHFILYNCIVTFHCYRQIYPWTSSIDLQI